MKVFTAMKNNLYTFYILILSFFFNGCTTIKTEIISEPIGARIEVENNYVGKTPITVTLRQDGFGMISDTIVVRALPIYDGQYTQIKVLSWETPVPKTLFFQMNLVPVDRN